MTDNQSLSKVKVNLPATQTPIATSFDPNADLMVARAVQMTSQPKTEPISLSFGRVAALGKMTITNLGLAADETVKNASVSRLPAKSLQVAVMSTSLRAASLKSAISAPRIGS